MNNKALNYFSQGYSCSEAIVKAGIDEGLAPKELLPAATAFSGGMSSGCLCGAVSGAQMVISAVYGKNEIDKDGTKARKLARKLVEEFKKKNKSTCCRVLTSKYEYNSPERRANCARLVGEASSIAKMLLERSEQKV